MDEMISKRAAIDALWKALYEYEDKTEKQFQESEELDVADWFQHRIFVQNISDIDRQTILNLPPAQPDVPETNVGDTISRQAAIDAIDALHDMPNAWLDFAVDAVMALPPVQSERLTDDDFETIRIHLNAYKEKLCNQQRWKEAEEYQRIIDRFMAFASAQPEPEEFEWCTDCKEYDQEKHCCPRWNRVIRNTIEEIKGAQPEQRWIPVTERLPKPYEYCLWTTTDGRVIYHHCDGLFSNYIAWMPLPTAYERSEE